MRRMGPMFEGDIALRHDNMQLGEALEDRRQAGFAPAIEFWKIDEQEVPPVESAAKFERADT